MLAVLDGADVLVSADALRGAGIDVSRGAERLVSGEEYVSLSSLSSAVRWKLDAEALELAIDSIPDPNTHTTVDLQSPRPEMEYRSDTSAFLNYSVQVTDLSSVYGYTEAGLSRGNARLYTGVSLPFTADDARPIRDMSNFTVDFRDKLLRVIVGDSASSGGALGGGGTFGGIQVARSFELDPYFTPTPTLDRSADVLAPSTLEVYVNGQLVHREDVQPGAIDIHNIPATAGAGDTKIVLRDALGRATVLQSSFYRPTHILAVGERDYSFTVGLERAGLGIRSWDYGAPAMLDVYRVGVLPDLTLTSRAEASTDRVSGGGGAVVSVGIGQIEVNGAVSVESSPGGAASLSYAYNGRRFGGALWSRAATDGYATLSQSSADDRALLDVGASVNVPLGLRASATLAGAASQMRDSGLTARVSASSGVRLPAHLYLSVLGSWRRAEASQDELNLSASLVTTVGRHTVVTASERGSSPFGGPDASDPAGEEADPSLVTSAEVQRSLPQGTGVGYRVGGSAGNGEQAFAYLNGQISVGQASANYTWSPDLSSSVLGVAGGLVAIGGRLVASRPLQGAYALVQVPGLSGVEASLNNNPVGETNRHGDLVVTGLQANSANRISISDANIPLDYAVEGTHRVVAPPTRGGVVVRFPVTQVRIVRGHIRVGGASAAFGEMEINLENDPLSSPIGADGAFEFVNLPQGDWTATARYSGGTCRAAVHVPAATADNASVDLGTIPCEAPEG